jgi:hypothetical protein
MKSLRKTGQLTIRFTKEQLVKLRQAAAAESRRRGEVVDPGTLLREMAMAEIDRRAVA